MTFGFSILNNLLHYAAFEFGGGQAVVLVLTLVGLAITIWLIVQRLKNLGYSGWWAFGIIVPILNMLVGLRCLCCPEGYADHKTLDRPAKIMAGLLVGAIVLGILGAIIVANM